MVSKQPPRARRVPNTSEDRCGDSSVLEISSSPKDWRERLAAHVETSANGDQGGGAVQDREATVRFIGVAGVRWLFTGKCAAQSQEVAVARRFLQFLFENRRRFVLPVLQASFSSAFTSKRVLSRKNIRRGTVFRRSSIASRSKEMASGVGWPALLWDLAASSRHTARVSGSSPRRAVATANSAFVFAAMNSGRGFGAA